MNLNEREWMMPFPFLPKRSAEEMERPARAGPAGGVEQYCLDLVFRLTLVFVTQGISTVSDLPPLLSAVGQKGVMQKMQVALSLYH